MNKPIFIVPTLGALLASVALVGCNRQDDGARTAAQKNDPVVAQSDQRAQDAKSGASQGTSQTKEAARDAAQDAKSGASQGMSETKEAARDAAQDVKQAGKQASEQAGGAVSDAVITASVNAGLAKDKSLSALKIDVDTAGGRVAMHGSAPDAASRDRATEIAQGVKGVVSVDNQLTVATK